MNKVARIMAYLSFSPPPPQQKLFVIITFSKHIVEQMVSLMG